MTYETIKNIVTITLGTEIVIAIPIVIYFGYKMFKDINEY